MIKKMVMMIISRGIGAGRKNNKGLMGQGLVNLFSGNVVLYFDDY